MITRGTSLFIGGWPDEENPPNKYGVNHKHYLGSFAFIFIGGGLIQWTYVHNYIKNWTIKGYLKGTGDHVELI